jgi:hypothetical protein
MREYSFQVINKKFIFKINLFKILLRQKILRFSIPTLVYLVERILNICFLIQINNKSQFTFMELP